MAANRSGDETMAAFVGHLRRLKCEGCNLLVIGEGPGRLFARASAQMLGGGEARRYRALAVIERSAASARQRLPDDTGSKSDSATVVTRIQPARSTAAEESETDDEYDRARTDPSAVPERRVESETLAALGTELEEAIETFDARADGLKPAQLRLCVDSLAPLIDDYDEAELRAFLHRVTDRVRKYDGMAHYVLAEPYESEVVQRLEPAFDAVVELQPSDGDAPGRERWHLPDEDVTMPWLPV